MQKRFVLFMFMFVSMIELKENKNNKSNLNLSPNSINSFMSMDLGEDYNLYYFFLLFSL